MSVTVSQVIEDVKSLSVKERAFLARCLISSLDTTSRGCVDDEWAELAKKRYDELESGLVNSTSWDEIKKKLEASFVCKI